MAHNSRAGTFGSALQNHVRIPDYARLPDQKSCLDRMLTATVEKDRPDAREFGDWTRKGPLPDVGGQRRVPERAGFGSGARNFDNVSEAGSERGGRRGYDNGESKTRDFADWSRKGPLTPTLPTGPAARSLDRPMSRDGPKDRRNSPSWGEGRSQEGSRPPRREFVERPVADRAPTAPELDNQWRSKMRPDPPASVPAAKSPALSNRELSNPPSPAAAPAAPLAPATRPRLNLQKRTVSESPSDAAASPAVPDAKASPFGAARPIDTAAKEKELEEKRQIAAQEKKEAEDKGREEKRLAEDKAREEKRQTKEAERAARAERADKEPASPKGKPNGQQQEKENGVTSPTGGKNYEILRRNADQDTTEADEEADEGNANGTIVDDKAIKPKEIVRDMTDDETKVNGTSTEQSGTPVESTADALEDDGWNTVPSKARTNKKNGKPVARAIAS